jgi:phosphate starvation-inducible PhoH-like protein
VNKIVITRPVVSVDEEIGFLPGGLESKMDPWTRPIFDSLRETYTAKEIERMMDEGIIEIVPLGFMRGRTFKNAWIVADEMQNSSPTQMFMLATRIGEGSKMIITGDLNQSDRNMYDNGLREICDKVRWAPNNGCVQYVELNVEDVQRSRAAKCVLDIYALNAVEDRVENKVMDGAINKHVNNTTVNSDISIGMDTLDFDESVDGYHEFSSEPLSSKEWVQEFPEFNDAALIPLDHMKKLNGRLI